MLLKLSLRTFIIGLFVASTLWMLVTFLPVVYSMIFPPRDLQQIVRALELRETSALDVAPAVQQVIAQAGPLKRAVHVGYHVGVTETIQHLQSHRSKTTQMAYIAWFGKLPKPILLLIMRNEVDGALDSYDIYQGTPMSMVTGFAYPILLFAISLYLLRKRKSPMLADDPLLSQMPD